MKASVDLTENMSYPSVSSMQESFSQSSSLEVLGGDDVIKV